ncbi:hypothetical protein PS862_00552 [Pseudomonas fluorescens]|uniref:Uncharacterized protein n=1 Tax=Pseudomonas fluorescens TaxID=294 RepID=A0A5E6PJK8_PSEFL|nr:hypothetical protein PS639_00390 [Pseudomonas fluorescens]VVO55798.1 hypothetical protein PS862_00552 [Pseudomonas fluorescens]
MCTGSLWISLWLNSGKTPLEAVVTGLAPSSVSPRIVQIALGLHGRTARVKQKNFKMARQALYTAGFSFFTCPRNVWMGLWIRCVHIAVTRSG